MKNFFRRFFHWLSNNVWLQLVLIVGSIFSFIFTLPIVAKKIRDYRQKRQDPDNFYARYQVPEPKIKSMFDSLKDQDEPKLIMFKPPQNSVTNEIKNSLATFIKQQKISLQVVMVDAEKFPAIFNDHFDFFNATMNSNQYLESCPMPQIQEFDDFLNHPVLVLWHQKQIKQVISNVCGAHDEQKVSFLKHFWQGDLK